eukprot:NODE_455_length_7230_cov_0.733277.p4 type:complete len:135 gc:universal NODE_455_length_7230_cov_0.733277:5259-4855(-)
MSLKSSVSFSVKLSSPLRGLSLAKEFDCLKSEFTCLFCFLRPTTCLIDFVNSSPPLSACSSTLSSHLSTSNSGELRAISFGVEFSSKKSSNSFCSINFCISIFFVPSLDIGKPGNVIFRIAGLILLGFWSKKSS